MMAGGGRHGFGPGQGDGVLGTDSVGWPQEGAEDYAEKEKSMAHGSGFLLARRAQGPGRFQAVYPRQAVFAKARRLASPVAGGTVSEEFSAISSSLKLRGAPDPGCLANEGSGLLDECFAIFQSFETTGAPRGLPFVAGKNSAPRARRPQPRRNAGERPERKRHAMPPAEAWYGCGQRALTASDSLPSSKPNPLATHAKVSID
jgi:hypothetical protein